MSSSARKIAVITGDLVNSSKLGEDKIDLAFKALEANAHALARWHDAQLHFSRHRGDGWQVVLERPKLALRSALAFRAALRINGSEFDSYMGIVEGQVEGSVGPDLNDETAQVFVRSGMWLDWTKNTLASGETRMAYEPETIFPAAILADYITKRWTPVQAEAILPFLAPGDPPSFTKVAEEIGKSRQAVTKSVEAAGLDALRAALTLIEAHDD